MFAAGDFSLNCLDYHKKSKSTRVKSKTGSLIVMYSEILFLETSLKLKKRIIKSDVSDHFPVFVSLCYPSKVHKEHQKITIHKRVTHDTNLMAFQIDLHNVNWNSTNHSPETYSKYKTFFKIFSELYKKHFLLKEFQIKVKDLQAP